MKIGEFAKICGTKISVLRHYDKEKLLIPEHTDVFSGYRYYSSEQILTYHRITALKKAGFTLHEIKELISYSLTNEEITAMFGRKEEELRLALKNLKEAESIMSKLNIIFKNDKAKVRFKAKEEIDILQKQMEAEIKAADYQRISQYSISGDEITCDVVKLGEEIQQSVPDIPFADDADVVGKWEIIGNFAVKADFYDNAFCEKEFYGGDIKHLYFLPKGERYWGFCWTKGYFIDQGYLGTVYNEYETEKIGNDLYMFISLKEYEYAHGGKPTCLVLKKADNKEYSPESLARKDDINKPFVNDERIIGRWRAHSFLGNKSEFPAEEEPIEDLYFKEIEFFSGGSCRCVYADDVFEGDDKLVWTKNYLLRKWNWSACEYEIRTVNGTEYMIIEWKSGDYRYGGFDTNYYVFVRS
ncbi:MAG: MerR family transcriptional regulator [Clostridia bacterium]|nr:MerR family transcriptional regulator [Clostridia bacterium]